MMNDNDVGEYYEFRTGLKNMFLITYLIMSFITLKMWKMFF
jgi:hypothetical protein